MAYSGGPKQIVGSCRLAGPWLNLMRNSLNAQVWSYKNPDFLCVSGTHGSAHLALYDQAIWDKYQLAELRRRKIQDQHFDRTTEAGIDRSGEFRGARTACFQPADNAIPTLMRRGVVFLACHNAIAELADRLIKKGVNPGQIGVRSAGRGADQSSDSRRRPHARRRGHLAVAAGGRLPLRQIVLFTPLANLRRGPMRSNVARFLFGFVACALLTGPAVGRGAHPQGIAVDVQPAAALRRTHAAAVAGGNEQRRRRSRFIVHHPGNRRAGRFSWRSHRSQARFVLRRQLLLRDRAFGASVRGGASGVQGPHLLGNNSSGAIDRADREGRPHHRRQHDMDRQGRRLISAACAR